MSEVAQPLLVRADSTINFKKFQCGPPHLKNPFHPCPKNVRTGRPLLPLTADILYGQPRASAEKFPGKGATEKRPRKIALLSLTIISIMYENPKGRHSPCGQPLFFYHALGAGASPYHFCFQWGSTFPTYLYTYSYSKTRPYESLPTQIFSILQYNAILL